MASESSSVNITCTDKFVIPHSALLLPTPSSLANVVADSVRLELSGPIARITLARPARRNALDEAAWHRLSEICVALRDRRDVAVIVICGEGEHFSAGADIHELSQHIGDAAWMRQNQATIAAAIDSYASLPQPTVAIIRGCCFGGGAALAAASDFRLAANGSRFAITPAKLGLTYRLVDCARVVELVGAAQARELLLMGTEWSDEKAMHYGFINALFPIDALAAETDMWLEKLSSLSNTSQRGIKATLLKIRAGTTQDDEETTRAFSAAFEESDFIEAARTFTTRSVR